MVRISPERSRKQSLGGAQALRIGLHHLDQFAYIGAFSPAIDITDTTKDYDGGLASPTRLNQQLRLLWIGIGRDDLLFAPSTASKVLELSCPYLQRN
jgi:enterochelin esterase-like enzyme